LRAAAEHCGALRADIITIIIILFCEGGGGVGFIPASFLYFSVLHKVIFFIPWELSTGVKNNNKNHDNVYGAVIVTKVTARVTIRYDTRCYFNVRSKADISQLNLPHGTDN